MRRLKNLVAAFLRIRFTPIGFGRQGRVEHETPALSCSCAGPCSTFALLDLRFATTNEAGVSPCRRLHYLIRYCIVMIVYHFFKR